MDLSKVSDKITKVLVTEEQIDAKVAELAAQIDVQYAGKDVLLVGVLKGAVMFMADLSRAIQIPVQMDWMAVSSYGSGTKSSGVVRILKDLDRDITGRNVLIVEDIVDTGITMEKLFTLLSVEKPASLEIVTLLHKPEAFKGTHTPTYIGFSIPNKFVVGYGLDYNELGRNTEHIYQLKGEESH
mgnify:CR=1 FL=1